MREGRKEVKDRSLRKLESEKPKSGPGPEPGPESGPEPKRRRPRRRPEVKNTTRESKPGSGGTGLRAKVKTKGKQGLEEAHHDQSPVFISSCSPVSEYLVAGSLFVRALLPAPQNTHRRAIIGRGRHAVGLHMVWKSTEAERLNHSVL